MGSPSSGESVIVAAGRSDLTSARREAMRRFSEHHLALVGLGILVIVVLMAIFAPLIAPQGPTAIDLSSVSAPPSAHHLLGTDEIGRDVWARLVYGARTSLTVGFGAVALALLVGTILGLLAGVSGGWLDNLLMRVTDAFMSIPALFLAIFFVAIAGPSIGAVIIVIALTSWTQCARLVRGQVLGLREREFVLAAHIIGVPRRRVITDHLLPNLLGPLSVLGTFAVATAVLLEAGLSFLGLGVRPPAPSWGEMVSAAQSPVVLLDQPWIWVPPSVGITLVVLAVNFVGDGLRDAVDPRSQL